jgi:hypothetical protein
MMSAKNIIDLLEKEKFVIYFVLLWGGSFFFWNIASEIYYISNMNSALNGFAFVINLFELIAGIMLALLGFKLLGMKFLPMLTKEKLLVYFVLLWAASFFLWAIYDIANFGASAEGVIRLLGALCDLGAGAVLALFGWKLFSAKDQAFPPPPPPPMA